MSKVKILLFSGIFISILPYLGFPFALKSLLISLCGLEIIYLSYIFYGENKEKTKTEEEVFDNFSENNDFVEVVLSREESETN